MPQDTNRKFSRMAVQVAVSFQLKGGARMQGMSGNMNISGMFIETLTPGAFGEEVTVFLKLPGFKEEVPIKATVRWLERDGMGVQFASMGARETHGLTQLISALKNPNNTPPSQ